MIRRKYDGGDEKTDGGETENADHGLQLGRIFILGTVVGIGHGSMRRREGQLEDRAQDVDRKVMSFLLRYLCDVDVWMDVVSTLGVGGGRLI